MAFETFDLGKVLQTAEAIKGMRRQEADDVLRRRYLETQIQGSEQDLQMRAEQHVANKQASADAKRRSALTQLGSLAQQALSTSPDPQAHRAFVAQVIQNPAYQQVFADAGVDVSKMDINHPNFDNYLQTWASLGPQASPDAQLRAKDAQAGRQLGERQLTEQVRHNRATEANAAKKPGSAFRPLTPEEASQVGLPPGTAAQVDESTGKIDVLSKRDTTGALSQKDMTTAKMKLNTVNLARQQLNAIRQSFDEGTKGVNAFGPVQGLLPTEAGHGFDRRVDQMRSTLTALTRVPGVGAMSDYETRLDQAKFPSRSEYEKVTKQQIEDLDNMLNAIERGYTDLLSGGASAPAASGGWTVTEVK